MHIIRIAFSNMVKKKSKLMQTNVKDDKTGTNCIESIFILN